jgi:hypothetical protein
VLMLAMPHEQLRLNLVTLMAMLENENEVR